MDDDRLDAGLAAMLAPPRRPVDTAFATQVARLVALDRRLAAATRASRRRTAIGVLGAFTAAAALSLLATVPSVGALVAGPVAAPAALLLMLLILAAQAPAFDPR